MFLDCGWDKIPQQGLAAARGGSGRFADLRQQRARPVALCRVDHAKMPARFRWLDDGERIVGENDDGGVLALGKVLRKIACPADVIGWLFARLWAFD